MPLSPQPGSPPTTTIPVELRPAMRAMNPPYNGPWTVAENVAVGLIEDARRYINNHPDDTNTVDQTLIDIINSLTSGSPSSSGSGVGMTAKQERNLRNAYLERLKDWKFGITPNLEKLMNRGVQEEWSLDSFVLYLRKTEEYQKQFQGIFENDGGLRISEEQYLAQYTDFKDMAQRSNFDLNKAQFAILLKRGVQADEWQTRTVFLERITRNPDYFRQVERVATARGILKPKESLTKKSLYDAMLRRGSPQIERLLEESNVMFQLQNAGLFVGEHGAIKRKSVLRLIRQVEAQGGEAELMTSADFAGLTEKVKTILPMARQHGFNISKRDLFILEFGGPGRDDIARYVENITTSVEREETEPAGTPLLIEDEGGSRLLSGAITRPQSQ